MQERRSAPPHRPWLPLPLPTCVHIRTYVFTLQTFFFSLSLSFLWPTTHTYYDILPLSIVIITTILTVSPGEKKSKTSRPPARVSNVNVKKNSCKLKIKRWILRRIVILDPLPCAHVQIKPSINQSINLSKYYVSYPRVS